MKFSGHHLGGHCPCLIKTEPIAAASSLVQNPGNLDLKWPVYLHSMIVHCFSTPRWTETSLDRPQRTANEEEDLFLMTGSHSTSKINVSFLSLQLPPAASTEQCRPKESVWSLLITIFLFLVGAGVLVVSKKAWRQKSS